MNSMRIASQVTLILAILLFGLSRTRQSSAQSVPPGAVAGTVALPSRPAVVGPQTLVSAAAGNVVDDGSASDLKRLESLINELAKQHIPHRYSKNKGWGAKKERWDGLHVQLKDFQLKTKRRKKMVNHGTWKRYSAELVNPKQRLAFQLHSVKKDKSGVTRILLSVTADMKLFGRISEWVKGVQIYSVSAEGFARVRLNLSTSIKTRLDFASIPPDLYLDPRIDQADLKLIDFRIKKISKVGGEVAQQVGRSIKKILDDKINEYEIKLVSKMNKSIAKRKDDLKLSVSELVDSEWSKFESYLVPEKDGKAAANPEKQSKSP